MIRVMSEPGTTILPVPILIVISHKEAILSRRVFDGSPIKIFDVAESF
jgi:hypothetical protein